MTKPEILIIDDEPQMRRLLHITLQSNGYLLREAATAREGLIMAANHPPDLILLDLGLPDRDGQDVLKELRKWYTQPVFILSVLKSEDDIVTALDNGANDYLAKPFRTGELLARMRAALRGNVQPDQHPVIVFEGGEIDLATRAVRKNGENVRLTATEYNLLALLARNAGKVLTHQFLLKAVWGPDQVSQSQYLRVFVAQLRKKIEGDPNRPRVLLTESGIGYRFMGMDS